jgi:hypothetical protein
MEQAAYLAILAASLQTEACLLAVHQNTPDGNSKMDKYGSLSSRD